MTEDLAAEWAAPESLVLWDKNPRKNARTVGKIVKSIQAFGFGQPLVARRSDRVVVAGNTRLLAAREMKLARVPVRFIDLTDKQLEAYAEEDAGLKYIQSIVWVKNVFGNSRTPYRFQHEPAHLCSKGDMDQEKFFGGRSLGSCLFFDKPSRNNEHPTAKPTDLLVRLILNHTKPGELVRDCFGGGGSTLVAAAQSGRTASLCELDPKYCDVIRKRWARYAQVHAEDVGDGIVENTVRA